MFVNQEAAGQQAKAHRLVSGRFHSPDSELRDYFRRDTACDFVATSGAPIIEFILSPHVISYSSLPGSDHQQQRMLQSRFVDDTSTYVSVPSCRRALALELAGDENSKRQHSQ
jgi:hypothetical protein